MTQLYLKKSQILHKKLELEFICEVKRNKYHFKHIYNVYKKDTFFLVFTGRDDENVEVDIVCNSSLFQECTVLALNMKYNFHKNLNNDIDLIFF